MSLNERIEELRSILSQLEEFKTEEDLEIEELFSDENERKEFLDYLFRVMNDCVVAKNSTFGDKQENYKKRECVLLEAIRCLTSFEEKSIQN